MSVRVRLPFLQHSSVPCSIASDAKPGEFSIAVAKGLVTPTDEVAILHTVGLSPLSPGRAMSRAYDEIVDFIAGGATSEAVADYEPSEQAKGYVADLIHKEKTVGLSAEESSELDHFLKIEHLMRLAKARARTLCSK